MGVGNTGGKDEHIQVESTAPEKTVQGIEDLRENKNDPVPDIFNKILTDQPTAIGHRHTRCGEWKGAGQCDCVALLFLQKSEHFRNFCRVISQRGFVTLGLL